MLGCKRQEEEKLLLGIYKKLHQRNSSEMHAKEDNDKEEEDT